MSIQSEAKQGIPIVYGVTGHRDIPESDVPILYAAVRDFFRDEVRGKYIHTPVVFLSALAEGADRIAAHAALEVGCKLGVFLPFATDEYLRDFESESSKAEFRELLTQAEFVEIAPRLSDTDPNDRDQAYVAVGVAIARYAQCLIALWDGVPIEKPGGTADVVRIYRTGVPALRPMLDDIISEPECGPVVHFLTRRSSNPDAIPIGEIGLRQFLPPVPSGRTSEMAGMSELEQSRWDKVFSCMNRFNEDVASIPPFDNGHPYTTRYLMPSSELASQWPIEDEKARRIARLYESADILSMESQAKRLGYLKQIIGLTLVAVIFEQFYSGPFALPVLLAISIVWALVATWRYRKIGSNRLEEKYLDYRTLAEAARVQFFWHLSGLPDSPADHYLRDQRDELEWLRQAIRAIDLPTKTSTPTPSDKIGIQIAVSAWVKDQLGYFHKNAPKQARLDEKFSRQARRWFFSAIGMVLFTVAFHFCTIAWMPDIDEMVIPSLPVIYGMLFAISGVIKFYQNVMAYQEHANRYRKMEFYFQLCNNRIERALEIDDLPAAQLLLLMMGRQALAENSEWLLLHRQRPIEVPLGG